MAFNTLPNSLSYVDLVQAPLILIGALNAGASYIASPLTMPMMADTSVPAKYQAHQWSVFLEGAESIFPPTNAMQTFANVVLSILAYRAAASSDVAAAKLPRLALAAACNIGTTAFALSYMAPINQKMRASGLELMNAGESKNTVELEKRYRAMQAKWAQGNKIRGVMMTGAAVAGMWALLTRG